MPKVLPASQAGPARDAVFARRQAGSAAVVAAGHTSCTVAAITGRRLAPSRDPAAGYHFHAGWETLVF